MSTSPISKSSVESTAGVENQYVFFKSPMGESKALETALNNELLSSHGHTTGTSKSVFSPPPFCNSWANSRANKIQPGKHLAITVMAAGAGDS